MRSKLQALVVGNHQLHSGSRGSRGFYRFSLSHGTELGIQTFSSAAFESRDADGIAMRPATGLSVARSQELPVSF
jgi:hypothetical protein